MLSLLLVLACATDPAEPGGDPTTGTTTGTTVLDGTTTETGTDDPCAGLPAVTWESWGDGFFRTWCQGCHSATTDDRNGAPPGMDFDSEAQVFAMAATIRQAVLVDGSMPLGGGVSESDAALLDVLLSCGLDEDPGTTTGGVEEEPPPAPLDAAGFEAAVAAALADGLGDPWTAREGYRLMLSGRETGCPFGNNQWNMSSSFDGCTTSAGWVYAGIVEYDGEVETLPDEAEFFLLADAWISDAEGHRWVGAGEAELSRTGNRDTGQATGRLAGTWSLDAGQDWLDAGYSGVLELAVTWADPAWTVAATGSQGSAHGALYLDGIEGDATTCPAGGGGALSLRDDSGSWFTLDLSEGCGCGPLTWAGAEDLGTACVDLSAAFQGVVQAVSPW